MHVEKIEIPAFRVLRDVVLEFGEAYDPQIFPIGSENGGGKSTLLQLVFALLHCSADERRIPYLANLLSSDSYTGDEDERLIARLTLRIEGKSHTLEFIELGYGFLGRKLEGPPRLGFKTAAVLEHIQAEDQDELLKFYRESFQNGKRKIEISAQDREALQEDLRRMRGLWVALNYHYVTAYERSTSAGAETRALICHVQGQSSSATEARLRAASSRVFLLGPSSQQYLFLDMAARRMLTTRCEPEDEDEERPQFEYLSNLSDAEEDMAGFYAYDWLSVEPLIRLFASARDEDFKGVVKTGSYGNSYNALLQQVNRLLVGKEVRPIEDLSGVEFVISEGGHEVVLSPEDLSQGELKRLMIYAWLRANRAHDALVLIDEIETSFHPDWQAGIVRDLQEWAPNTQFLLATHSYEVCQALTPRHVRELRPKLRWSSTTSTETGDPEPRDG
ncbi:AAA family ATPase [Paraliomyxa miuraensis]|uniref:AAA family ATPase n=1 Tax=Paraliomyxa miuraensis TaxID=376150 RepID=UPI002257C678|nr:AAA family ATPase [Paraliomyxa miuraensis]MCX4247058.1 AAA family ATPase [Paraliomyxa miuraensis]